MKFCRIDLSKTNYSVLPESFLILGVEIDDRADQLKEIYRKYCIYKKFESVMPLFDGMLFDRYTDVIGYLDNAKLSAFSLIKRYDRHNAEALQFAWDYEHPESRLGIESLKSECAYYKKQGFKYLYLGEVADYKSTLDGYEELGNQYV